jgi:hypothetical protein
MSFVPVVNVANVNPEIVSIDNTVIDQIINGWFDTSFDPSKYIAGSNMTSALDTVVNIPDAIPLARAVASGAPVPKVGLSGQTVSVFQKHYAQQVAIDAQKYNLSPGAVEMFSKQLDSVGASKYFDVIVERAIMNALAANATQTNIDNLSTFATNHAVDPTNPSRTNPVTGATTQSNLFTGRALNFANLTYVISQLRTLCFANGLPINAKKFTLWVTPANEVMARHLVTSEFLGFSTTFSSSDSAGSHSNPNKALFASGTTIDVEVMNKYPTAVGGTVTDWYITTGVMPPFAVKVGRQPTITKLFNPSDVNMVNHNELVVDFKADVGVALMHHLAIAKCTA